MIPTKRPVILCSVGKDLQGLAKAPPGFEISLVPNMDRLVEAVRGAPPEPVVILDVALLRDWARLRDRVSFEGPAVPSASVIAVIPPGEAVIQNLVIAGRLGASEVWDLRSEASEGGFRLRLDIAEASTCSRLAREFFGEPKSWAYEGMLHSGVATVLSGGQAEDWAARLGIDRRTLTARCAAAGLPAPRRLLAWVRLLLAARLLDEPQRRISDIARYCGYSGLVPMRTAFNAFVGAPPGVLRERGASPAVHEAFRADRRPARRKRSSSVRQTRIGSSG